MGKKTEVWLLIAVFCVVLYIIAALPEYHQIDYKFKFERAEVVWYNHSYFRDIRVTFPFHNRTKRVLNATGYLLVDLTSTEVVIELQAYKFASNEYRFFPVTVDVNWCNEYAHNNFNLKTLLKNISNLHSCPLKKNFYYIYNFTPDYSRLPPFIPRGRYKGVAKLYYGKEKEFILEAHCYAEIVDTPTRWWK